jgi:hypothetical protein
MALQTSNNAVYEVQGFPSNVYADGFVFTLIYAGEYFTTYLVL